MTLLDPEKVDLETVGMRRSTLRDRPGPEPPEGGVLFTQPCKDTNEKVMAELRVFNGVPAGELMRFGVFDPHILCDLMECLVAKFELVKCSRDLGYGRADAGEGLHGADRGGQPTTGPWGGQSSSAPRTASIITLRSVISEVAPSQS